MSEIDKAILEIDMPLNCLECAISDYYEEDDVTERLVCPVLRIEIENYFEKHIDCPLKCKGNSGNNPIKVKHENRCPVCDTKNSVCDTRSDVVYCWHCGQAIFK